MILIGRTDPHRDIRAGIDLTILDPHNSISREHASIHNPGAGVYLIIDHGSMNGTFVNGSRLKKDEKHVLNEGDLVMFGDIRFEFKNGKLRYMGRKYY